jgi:hypothetical protein
VGILILPGCDFLWALEEAGSARDPGVASNPLCEPLPAPPEAPSPQSSVRVDPRIFTPTCDADLHPSFTTLVYVMLEDGVPGGEPELVRISGRVDQRPVGTSCVMDLTFSAEVKKGEEWITAPLADRWVQVCDVALLNSWAENLVDVHAEITALLLGPPDSQTPLITHNEVLEFKVPQAFDLDCAHPRVQGPVEGYAHQGAAQIVVRQDDLIRLSSPEAPTELGLALALFKNAP